MQSPGEANQHVFLSGLVANRWVPPSSAFLFLFCLLSHPFHVELDVLGGPGLAHVPFKGTPEGQVPCEKGRRVPQK